MLLLNKEKEDLLISKYGFSKNYTLDNDIYYTYGKSFTIYSISYMKYSGQLKLTNTRINLDMLYDLIKKNIIIKVPGENLIEKKKNRLRMQIEEMQQKLKELEDL